MTLATALVFPVPNIVPTLVSSSTPKFQSKLSLLSTISSSSSKPKSLLSSSRLGFQLVACLDSSISPDTCTTSTSSSTRLYVSGLSFRTTQEGLRNAFEKFGNLTEVNLVMDKIANRPRGFAFLRYTTEEESKKAIEGMHGKFLDGRVIFVEVAKPRSELRKS
ncbi:glycine-rich RNA-binding protein 4, mitochondrial [Heracleum sosnowskyi]|uniref:Glycine-rich RNA-binding protein 4, mitochondrial n=1 Tax=Heracleum sosnowskyi TaxID=360622 RepID=A0AAD8INM1_9APIA|nr:glycine-rich RNA-binding protein 4, mitochondrial [Heracleum sosnowskyi]